MTDPVLARMRQLIGSPEEWAANDLLLGKGELAFEVHTDGGLFEKVGDGARPYSQLPFFAAADPVFDFVAELAGPTGASLVGYSQGAPGSSPTTVEAMLREQVSVTRFAGCDPTGATPSTAAFRAAIATGRRVWVPNGTYLIDGALALNSSQTIQGENRMLAKLVLGFAGDLVTMSGFCQVRGLWLDGQGATYPAARGIVFGTTPTPMGFIDDCKVTDWGGYCVHFATDGAGTQSTISNSEIYRHDQSQGGVGFPTTENYGPARRMINVQCSGGILADLNAADNTMMIGCQANGLHFQDLGATATRTKKALIVCNRFSTTGTDITVLGEDNVLVGNEIAGNVVFGNPCKNSRAVGNGFAGGYGCVDNSGSKFDLANYSDTYVALTSYTPAWTGSGGNPVLGNGTLSGNYTRLANRMHVNINLVIGSTTTLGSGVWSFTLPAAMSSVLSQFACGIARIGQAAFLVGVAIVSPGDNKVQVYSHNTANGVGPTIPAAWATGNTMFVTVDYPIA